MSEKLNVNGKDDMMIFKEATIEVAKLLNHKKTVGKNFKEGMDKIKTRMEELMEKKETVNDKRKKGLNKKIRILKMRLELKKKTKDVSPSTSLTNYIDPRIVISWCKERNVELTKVYTKTLLKKFDWATNTEKGFYKNYLIK
jgi:DNA topoisomerase-1